ncbi:DNA mismatch endonuclease Vsr [Jannaschia sp. Os4]|uniref:very short patch repair endonuclease n=1 Tax=Jannaschia sp. Os4 TaxID=2807617 RepID=UPI0019398C97|nr:DNA mismatch endonuclease Vsr [Jannaschia sp. Os4]MBM2575366.1 DNA mismatch endonuclease Vsr [Jannaschia sp. Os4]
MADRISPEQRSRLMGRIKGKDTKPELLVRRTAHALGYRFRLHRKDLPGRPDLVFPRLRKIIFVHGCFWHSHDCPRGTIPKTNIDFWKAKLARNVERDRQAVSLLETAGWAVLVVWQCETKDQRALAERLMAFLGRASPKRAASSSPSRSSPSRRPE